MQIINSKNIHMKKEKQRFRRSRICSGTNYEMSRELGKKYLEEKHESHIEEIQIISSRITIKKAAYVSCFGRLIPISYEEAEALSVSVKIIWK